MTKQDPYKNRFPHHCRVYKNTDESPFSEGIESTLYEGECAKYSSSNLRTFMKDGVIKGEYAIDIPYLIKGCNEECLVDVTDFCGEYKGCQISDCQPVTYGKLQGTTIYFSRGKN